MSAVDQFAEFDVRMSAALFDVELKIDLLTSRPVLSAEQGEELRSLYSELARLEAERAEGNRVLAALIAHERRTGQTNQA